MIKTIIITGGLLLIGILGGCQSVDTPNSIGEENYVSPSALSDVETPKGENSNNLKNETETETETETQTQTEAEAELDTIIGESESKQVEDNEIEDELKIDTGRFKGRADSNFIEVAISGVQDPKSFNIFMLSEDLKEAFDGLGISEDDNIKFKYYENKNKQNVIVYIEKM